MTFGDRRESHKARRPVLLMLWLWLGRALRMAREAFAQINFQAKTLAVID